MLKDLYIRQVKINKSRIEDINSYPFCLPVVRNIDTLTLNAPVTFFVGENGTGKSTLLEAIAASFGFNPEGGSKNFNFSTRQSHSNLHEYVTLVKGAKRLKDGYFLRAESYYNVATELDIIEDDAPIPYKSYGGKSLHEQSHGESFLSLMLNRFGGNGLYLLDEPEAALSPVRQMTLLAHIDTLVKENSQFIIATHSPMLLAYPDAEIFVLEEDSIKVVPYKETEHYVITREFLNNPEKMLKELF